MRKLALLLFSIFFYLSFHAQLDSCGLKIGMNISGVVDWGRELPFVNVMKAARPWMTSNVAYVAGGVNPWDSGVIDSIPTDADGYPLELPYYVAGTDTLQAVHTLMTREIEGNYPSGTYVVLYDGEGEMEFSFDAVSILDSSPGRYEIDVVPDDGGILLKIVSSTLGNHIRNVRVLMPGTEFTYETEPFNPVFLDKLDPFPVVRFMDWGGTNGSEDSLWTNRRTTSHYTQFAKVAYEHMIDLCNYTCKDMWVCVPHKADSNYIAELATLIKSELHPELDVYVEYSNEVWNGQFSQFHWVMANLGSPDFTPYGDWDPHKIAYFFKRTFDIFSDVFTGQEDRITRVVAGQHYNSWIAEQYVNWIGADGFDAVSCGAYFSPNTAGYNALDVLGTAAVASDVCYWTREEIEDNVLNKLKEHSELAELHNKRLLLYEAGQHITVQPFGSTTCSYQDAIFGVQSDTCIYNIYNEVIEYIRDSTIADLFMHFVLASNQESRWGSWGSMDNIYDDVNDSPKYQALLDNIYNCPVKECSTEGIASIGEQRGKEFRIFPNPNGGDFLITNPFFENSPDLKLEILDILGNKLQMKHFSAYSEKLIPYTTGVLPVGIYFVSLQSGTTNFTTKMVLTR